MVRRNNCTAVGTGDFLAVGTCGWLGVRRLAETGSWKAQEDAARLAMGGAWTVRRGSGDAPDVDAVRS